MIKLALLGLLFSGMVQAQYSNESEVSVVVTGGNTEVEIYNGQTKNTYKKEKNTFVLGGHYTYATSSQVESISMLRMSFICSLLLNSKLDNTPFQPPKITTFSCCQCELYKCSTSHTLLFSCPFQKLSRTPK